MRTDDDLILNVRGLGKRFGGTVACHDINLTLHRGEVLGIVGESGSGKSTLLRCLAGRLEPDTGSIVIDIPLSGLTDLWRIDEARREQIRRRYSPWCTRIRVTGCASISAPAATSPNR